MSNEITRAAQKMKEAEKYRQSGQLIKAQKICEHLLKQYPDYFAALYTLGLIYADQGNHKAALFQLSQANAYLPEHPSTLIALGTVYHTLGTRDLAQRVLNNAAKYLPNDPTLLMTLAETQREETEYEKAIEQYKKVLNIAPNWVEASIGLSRSYQAIGMMRDSENILLDLYHKGVATLPVASGFCSLPKLPKNCDFKQLLEKCREGKKKLIPEEKTRFAYLDYHRLKDNHQYEEAFKALSLANTLKRKMIGSDAKLESAWQQDSLLMTRENNRPPHQDSAEFPISLFILGTSRSGKTTIEKNLSKAPEIQCGFENPIVLNAIRKTLRESGLLSSAQYSILPEKLETHCKEHYLKELQHRSNNKRIFTNTAPSRIHDAFKLITIFPNVRFLFVKRDTMDLISRIYATDYKNGNFYAYDLKSIQEHVNWYNQMIDTLCEQYPNHTAVVQYEDIAQQPNSLKIPFKKLTGLELPDITSTPHDIGYANPFKTFIEQALSEREHAKR
jgi:tetratricopeptide (TPR) repeat protein